MNVKRLRELMQIKQEYLAVQMGLSQQAISNMEQRETLDAPTLEKISSILKVPVDVIKNYDDEKTVMNIQNNFEGSNIGSGSNSYYSNCSLNPVEKWMEAMEENRRLSDENKLLYERLLQAEKDKVSMMERLMSERK